jgi:hypothetical protein
MQEIQDYYVKNDIVPKVPENWNPILWEQEVKQKPKARRILTIFYHYLSFIIYPLQK